MKLVGVTFSESELTDKIYRILTEVHTPISKLELTTQYLSADYIPIRYGNIPQNAITQHASGIYPEAIVGKSPSLENSRLPLLNMLGIESTTKRIIDNIIRGHRFGTNGRLMLFPADVDYITLSVWDTVHPLPDIEFHKLLETVRYTFDVSVKCMDSLKHHPYTSIERLYIRARNLVMHYWMEFDKDTDIPESTYDAIINFCSMGQDMLLYTCLSDSNTLIDMRTEIPDPYKLAKVYDKLLLNIVRVLTKNLVPANSTTGWFTYKNFQQPASIIIDQSVDLQMNLGGMYKTVTPSLIIRKRETNKNKVPTVYEMLDSWKRTYLRFQQNVVFRGINADENSLRSENGQDEGKSDCEN